MPAYLHFVRHAQGFHNLSIANEQLSDPDLTPLGKGQCAQLCKVFPHHDKITHLVASPMRRTLYTCLLSFEPAVAAGKVVTALPEIQEVSSQPCDIGSEPDRLRAEFPASGVGAVDLSRVTPGWNDKSPASPFAPEVHKLEARARAARLWLRDLATSTAGDALKGEGEAEEEVHIVAVTHGGFLHFLTQDYGGIDPGRGTGWENTEWRSYEFVDPSGADPDARLRETTVSWRRRRGSTKGLTETEQTQLRAVYHENLKAAFDSTQAAKESAVL